ncbi:Hypothetical protein SRAE_X000206000 [Strongyloides ratti]|uniref:Uncharacterized protein n=1 Tax=Strongyloides ratti TaxID=34506 RepID=A0A090KWT0_STRRB|nr:Hypothetical protein SRAE_X000206000 [Strongyloides ratti]CEF60322.1 Hypothetical protein SRAE_X000206000 [Strongyloides ratti]
MKSYLILSILLSVFAAVLIANTQEYDENSIGYVPEKRAMRNALVRFGRAGMRNALVRFGKRSLDNDIQEFALKRNAAPQPFVRFGRSSSLSPDGYFIPYGNIYENNEA